MNLGDALGNGSLSVGGVRHGRETFYSSLSTAIRLCFAVRLSPPLKNVALVSVPLARLLASQLTLATRSRISTSTEKTPEAATRVPSAPICARFLALAPLYSVPEPCDLPWFQPFLGAPPVVSISPPDTSGNSGASGLPAGIHRLHGMVTATRKAKLRWTQPKALINSRTKEIGASYAMAEVLLLRPRWKADTSAMFPKWG